MCVASLEKLRHLLQSIKEANRDLRQGSPQGDAGLGLVLVATPNAPPITAAQETKCEENTALRTEYSPFLSAARTDPLILTPLMTSVTTRCPSHPCRHYH